MSVAFLAISTDAQLVVDLSGNEAFDALTPILAQLHDLSPEKMKMHRIHSKQKTKQRKVASCQRNYFKTCVL